MSSSKWNISTTTSSTTQYRSNSLNGTESKTNNDSTLGRAKSLCNHPKYQLWFLMICLVVCCLLVSTFMAWPKSTSSGSIDSGSALREYIHELNKTIDHSIDPCDDFYGHVCGKWNRSLHAIPSSDILNHVYMQSQNIITSAFTEHQTSRGGKPSAVQLVVDLFTMCTGDSPRNKYDFVQRFVDDSKYGESLFVKTVVPCLETRRRAKCFKYTRVDWMDRYVQWWLLGMAPMLTITIEVDRNESDGTLVNRFQFKPVDYDYLTNDTERQNRMVKLMQKYFKLNYFKAIKPMVHIESHLAKYTKQAQLPCDPPIHRISLAQFKHETGNLIDWTSLLNKIALKSKAPFRVNDDELVLVQNMDFMSSFAQTIVHTPDQIVKKYMNLQFAYVALENVPPKMAVRERTFHLYGDPKLNCIESLKNDEHSLVISRLYLDQISNGDLAKLSAIKQKATELVKDIKQSFRSMLIDEVAWLDEHTRTYALKKLDSILELVAYPEVALNDTALDEMYGVNDHDRVRLDDCNGNYYVAKTRVNVKRNKNLMNKFKDHPEVIWPWKVNPASFGNCKYIRNQNAILIPMAMLQPPLFDLNYPAVINFAVLGFFIGHEMSHGFDREGCKFDMFGSEEVNWCSNQSRHDYVRLATCFEDQYGQLIEPRTGIKVNGRRTLNENIADNGGLREAYFAFKNHIGHSRTNQTDHADLFSKQLLSLYNHDQLFFINYAKVWCSKPFELFRLRNCVQNDQHSLPWHRVNVPLSNLAYFASAFKCPPDSKMNPSHKCTLW